MALGSRAWGAKLGHEGGAFMIGTGLLLRRIRRDLPHFFTIPSLFLSQHLNTELSSLQDFEK